MAWHKPYMTAAELYHSEARVYKNKCAALEQENEMLRDKLELAESTIERLNEELTSMRGMLSK